MAKTGATKNTSIHVRVDSDIRKDAEDILNSMGITISQFINMALYQVHIKRRIPFEIDTVGSSHTPRVNGGGVKYDKVSNMKSISVEEPNIDVVEYTDLDDTQEKVSNIWDIHT